MAAATQTDAHVGSVFRRAFMYDIMVGLVWGGAEHRHRQRMVDSLNLKPGEAVLDVGCGTGTLAIGAKRAVGATGRVRGADASEQMIARARGKAERAGAQIEFRIGPAQALPFDDASFDALVSTTVIHCIASQARSAAVTEMRRVLKPGGRALIVDFGGPAETRKSFFGRMHAHRNFDLNTELPDLRSHGFSAVEQGVFGFEDLVFVRAIAA